MLSEEKQIVLRVVEQIGDEGRSILLDEYGVDGIPKPNAQPVGQNHIIPLVGTS